MCFKTFLPRPEMTCRFPIPPLRAAWLLAATTLLTACAVQPDRQGRLQFQVDNAELFGQTVDAFRMPDGSEARLRVLNGQYSIKLQKYLRVIPLDKATTVKVQSVSLVNGRTLIVLDKAERNCNFKTHLISLQGAEVLAWDFGDCNTVPVVNTYADAATFDFAYPNKTIRFTYQDARLLRADYAGPPPGAPAAAAGPLPRTAARHQPGLPSAPTTERPSGTRAAATGPAPAPSGTARNTAAPATASTTPARRTPAAAGSGGSSNPTRVAGPAPAGAMNFPAQEQKPVRIVLDN
ncbi:hypothetical protein [uncultured Aquabacterium sp.]|uniref:hypothetical protein n=1 Tax=Aquabacterium sp. TaxID=1872578 RepID=UPI0025E1A9DE|nr:hypothetical protein [uncultured Aquabacterium sp.]